MCPFIILHAGTYWTVVVRKMKPFHSAFCKLYLYCFSDLPSHPPLPLWNSCYSDSEHWLDPLVVFFFSSIVFVCLFVFIFSRWDISSTHSASPSIEPLKYSFLVSWMKCLLRLWGCYILCLFCFTLSFFCCLFFLFCSLIVCGFLGDLWLSLCT